MSIERRVDKLEAQIGTADACPACGGQGTGSVITWRDAQTGREERQENGSPCPACGAYRLDVIFEVIPDGT